MAALDTTQSAELTRQPPRLMLTEPILTMRGIARIYGNVTALGGVDVTVYPGEVLGIVGESGSGKSTLLRMMNLEDTPDTGIYNLALPGHEGRNLFTLDRFERRMLRAHHIGIVYQNPHLGLLMNHTSSGNVAERLLIAGNRNFAELRERARQSLDASEFPIERMDARPNELSGGMQQRAACQGDRTRPHRSAARRADHRSRRQRSGAGSRHAEAAAARAQGAGRKIGAA